MDWVKVALPTGQVQEMVPNVAEALIASGAAKRYVPEVPDVQKSVVPVVETATIAPAENAIVKFVRGPRTKNKGK